VYLLARLEISFKYWLSMLLKKFLLYLLLFISLGSYSQMPIVEWVIDDANLVDFAIDPIDDIITLTKKQVGFELKKYSGNGDIIWSVYDTSNINDLQRISVCDDGSIYVFGNRKIYDYSITRPIGMGRYKTHDFYRTSFCIVRYSESGSPVDFTEHKPTTAQYGLQIKSISHDSKNNIFICAATIDTVAIDTSQLYPVWQDLSGDNGFGFAMKLTNDASSLIWLKEYDYHITLEAGSIDLNGNCFVAGSYYGGGFEIDSILSVDSYGNMDGFTIEYDSVGNGKRICHMGSWSNDGILSMSPYLNRELVISVFMFDTIFKFNDSVLYSNGIWESEQSLIICRINENFDLIWYKPLMHSHPGLSNLRIADANRNIMLGCNYTRDFRFEDIRLHVPDVSSTCIIKLDSLGESLWYKIFGNEASLNKLVNILTDSRENTYILCEYEGYIELDRFYISSENGGKYLCRIRFDSSYKQVSRIQDPEDIRLYPNPAKSQLTIELMNSQSEASMFLYNLNGQLLRHQKLTKAKSQHNIERLKSGLYIIKICTNNNTSVRRIIKN
jgi:hypothetical protein